MSQRQKIGLRKTHSSMHKRGVVRRKKLLKAAYDLLCEHEIGDISFRDIAERAEVPEGSAYHFYANRFDVFSTLAGELSAVFVAEHRRPVPRESLGSWHKLAEHFLESGVRVYRNNPPARELLIGGKTPPEVKLADRVNDREVAQVMSDIFSTHFSVQDEVDLNSVFYHFIEITDLILTLSVIEHGEITDAMIQEARFAGIGYLANYFENVRRK
jgi:AcrR family transcriptional regulator